MNPFDVVPKFKKGKVTLCISTCYKSGACGHAKRPRSSAIIYESPVIMKDGCVNFHDGYTTR